MNFSSTSRLRFLKKPSFASSFPATVVMFTSLSKAGSKAWMNALRNRSITA